MISLRCTGKHSHLLGRVNGSDPTGRVEIACVRCRSQFDRAKHVIYSFDFEGNVTRVEVVSK